MDEKVVILMADDDDDDYMLTKRALEKSRLVNPLHRVKDGEELIEYLTGEGKYEGKAFTRPGVILLDLNMPKKDGREALKEIKANPDLKDIPIIVFTTSKAEEDVYRTYNLGVNSFITKPVTFDSLIDVINTVGKYWFEIVRLPKEGPQH